MKTIPAFLLLAVMAAGCITSQPIQTQEPKNNQTYEVDYLFEHEGCKVYRFYDLGHYVYFTNCNGEAINRTDSTEVKNTIRKKNTSF